MSLQSFLRLLYIYLIEIMSLKSIQTKRILKIISKYQDLEDPGGP